MNTGTGLWIILAYSLFRDDKRIPRWMIAAIAVQFLLSAINAFGYVGRDSSALQSAAYPAIVNFVFGPLPMAMQSAFAFLALYWAARGWRSRLGRRQAHPSRAVPRRRRQPLVRHQAFELYLSDASYWSRAPVDNAIHSSWRSAT